MIERIKNVLTEAYYQGGISHMFTASYMIGTPKGLNTKELRILSKSMLANNITIQQVVYFIEETN